MNRKYYTISLLKYVVTRCWILAFEFDIIYLSNKETQQPLNFIVNINCNAFRLCR